jgi:hypothetical protein
MSRRALLRLPRLNLFEHRDMFIAQIGDAFMPPSGLAPDVDGKRARRGAGSGQDLARVWDADPGGLVKIGGCH